ncbi:MAG: hypothetical protein ABSA53_36450 [Streptosporangiaceae bacterium]
MNVISARFSTPSWTLTGTGSSRLFRLADVSDEVVLAGFGRLDQDGDGRISTREFQAGAAHAFLSQDAANPGTAMLGLP